MSDLKKEAMEIFRELSPENQANLLMCTRLAYIAERSVKKSLTGPAEQEKNEEKEQEPTEPDAEQKP